MELVYLVENEYKITDKNQAKKLEKFINYYKSKKFNKSQIKEIVQGLFSQINYSIYSNNKLEPLQMKEIRLGLKSKIDVSIYNSHEIHWGDMREIRLALEKGFDVSWYKNSTEYNIYQLLEIIRAENNNLDYQILINPKLDVWQLYKIRSNKFLYYYYKLKFAFNNKLKKV